MLAKCENAKSGTKQMGELFEKIQIYPQCAGAQCAGFMGIWFLELGPVSNERYNNFCRKVGFFLKVSYIRI